MCGRFQLSVKGKEISERFNVEVHDELHRPDPKLPLNFKGFNCAPFQYLPVITNDEPRKLEYFRWGLLPQWAKDERIAAKMINARSETVMDKPAFKTAFERKRCLIPANGFYEWNKNKVKQAYRFYMRDESLFAMAGLWERWKGSDGEWLFTFSILTTRANALLQDIHDRMPVILSADDENKWLYNNDINVVSELLKPFPAHKMERYPISALVNSVANDSEKIIQKQELPQTLF